MPNLGFPLLFRLSYRGRLRRCQGLTLVLTLIVDDHAGEEIIELLLLLQTQVAEVDGRKFLDRLDGLAVDLIEDLLRRSKPDACRSRRTSSARQWSRWPQVHGASATRGMPATDALRTSPQPWDPCAVDRGPCGTAVLILARLWHGFPARARLVRPVGLIAH